jgi:hypothetical protein
VALLFDKKQYEYGEMYQYDFEFSCNILKVLHLDGITQTEYDECSITLNGIEYYAGISHHQDYCYYYG